MDRIAYEKKTVGLMVELYCRLRERNRALCADCQALIVYAHQRLDRCKFGNEKCRCKVCSVHCYNPKMREKIRAVMRFAGPRMLFYHPITTLRYLLFR